MMDMQKFGRKISEFRNQQGMTQVELADRMNVTFQAISNWERGNTMPDASRLVELADILQVTMDELCGRNAKILNSAATGNLEEYMQENTVESEEVCDVAPALKGEQVEQLAQKIERMDFNTISELLPHLSDNMIAQLVRKAIENEENYENVASVFPFVPKETICEIAEKMIEKDMELCTIGPFIPEEAMKTIARMAYEKGGVDKIMDILPFIPSQTMKEIAVLSFEKNGVEGVQNILPFIPKETMGTIAKAAYKNHSIEGIDTILPFVPKEILEEIAMEELQKNGLKKICNLGPFLDKPFLEKLARKSVAENGVESVECIAYLLEQRVLDEIIMEQFL